MSTHDRKIISKKYQFSNIAHLPLSDEQIKLRDAIQEKIGSGIYALEHCRCLCGSGDAAIIAETDRYGFSLNTVICKSCGILRTDPRLDDRSLREFYSKEYQDLYFNSGTSSISAHFKAQRTNGLYIMDFLRAHYKAFTLKGKSVMEIGCSAGGILASFLDAGAEVRGYDLNDSYLEYGRSINKGLDLRHGGIDDMKHIRDRFDLVIMNHVLEHLADPKAAVMVACGLLKDSGILFLSVPSIKNAQYYNSPTRSYLGSLHIAHLYHFSRNALISVAEGLEPIYVDGKARGIFKRARVKKTLPFPREYERNMRFIRWRENSLSGAVSRRVDMMLHDHHFYTRATWLLHCLRNRRAG
ncbi:MAG: methyltransferase domain-containing protein [Candidatus Omnitrophica bacterium]|nr:methyltransferase domain-containing protein [Candidatus Omnitrophota bacterium]